MRALNLGGTWSPHTTERYYEREIGRPGKAQGRRLWLSPRPQSMRDNVQIFEGSCFLSTWSFVLQVKCAHCLQSHRKIVCAHPTFPSIQLPFHPIPPPLLWPHQPALLPPASVLLYCPLPGCFVPVCISGKPWARFKRWLTRVPSSEKPADFPRQMFLDDNSDTYDIGL